MVSGLVDSDRVLSQFLPCSSLDREEHGKSGPIPEMNLSATSSDGTQQLALCGKDDFLHTKGPNAEEALESEVLNAMLKHRHHTNTLDTH